MTPFIQRRFLIQPQLSLRTFLDSVVNKVDEA